MLDTESSSYTSGKSQVSYICNFIKNLTPVPILFCFANPLKSILVFIFYHCLDRLPSSRTTGKKLSTVENIPIFLKGIQQVKLSEIKRNTINWKKQQQQNYKLQTTRKIFKND